MANDLDLYIDSRLTDGNESMSDGDNIQSDVEKSDTEQKPFRTLTIEMLLEIAEKRGATFSYNDNMTSSHPLRLACANAHPRDVRVTFDEERHL